MLIMIDKNNCFYQRPVEKLWDVFKALGKCLLRRKHAGKANCKEKCYLTSLPGLYLVTW